MNRGRILHIFKIILDYLYAYKWRKLHKTAIQINNLPNKKIVGEEDWEKKWSQFGMKPAKFYYRLYSHYIGPNINIVPKDICSNYIELIMNPYKYVPYYSDKNIFDKLFPSGFLPNTILRRMNGFFYDSNYNRVLMNDARLEDTIYNSVHGDSIILKPSVGGMGGKGIQLYVKKQGNCWENIKTKEILTLNYLINYSQDFIIQDCIIQHNYFKQFNDSSVNSMRICVYRSVKDDQTHTTAAVLRIGGKGSIVDNASSGGYFAGIDIKTGKLSKFVCNHDGVKKEFFNGIDFKKDYEIPEWSKIIDFAKTSCKYIPHHRIIALDIVVDKDNIPHLIEFNIKTFTAWLYQFTISPAWGEYTDEIIQYCLEHLNNRERVSIF